MIFHSRHFNAKERGFTLLELLIVLGIIAILAAILVIVINPAEWMRRSRDSKRLADLNSINHALTLAFGIDSSLNPGAATTVYVSLPDDNANCGSWGPPPIIGWTYRCVSPANLEKVDGTGWIPVNFASLPTGSPLSNLPVDPVNVSSSGLYYTYNIGGSWKLTAEMESSNDEHFEENDGGLDPTIYEVGNPAIGPSLARGTPTPTSVPTETPTETPTPTPIPIADCTPNIWAQKIDFAGVRYNAASFAIGSKGYVGTGYTGSSRAKDLWEYDLAANSWTQKAVLTGVAREYAAGFSIGDKGYVGTGYDGTSRLKDLWEYDPAGNSWTQKADFGGTVRQGAAGFAIGSHGYIGTGWDGSNYYDDFYEYNQAANTWKRIAYFGGAVRREAAAFSIGDKGYVGTGYNPGYLNDFWEYNPTTNKWTQKANFGGTTRYAAVGFSVGDKGYIGTGEQSGYTRVKDFYEYDPVANSWTKKADFGGTARTGAAGFGFFNGFKGFIVGGYDGSAKKDTWEYCSAASPTSTPAPTPAATPTPGCDVNTWKRKLDVPGIRYGAASFTINDKGYVSTGTNGSGRYKDIWEYQPGPDGSDVWTSKTSLTGAAREHAAGFVIGNKGYIGTGYDGTSRLKDLWEYDPAGNAWTQKADFGGVARQYAVGFASGGKGYIGTGWTGSSNLGDFWEYNPTSNVWIQKANFGGTARREAVAFTIDDRGFVGTGYDTGYKNDFWEYDAAFNDWYPRENFGGTARYGAAGFSVGNRGYIGTGEIVGYSNAKDFWEFNYDDETWTKKTDFPGTARKRATGFGLYDVVSRGFVATGNDGSAKKDNWEYCSAATPTPSPPPGGCVPNTWTRKANFSTAKYGAVGFSVGTKGYIGTGYDTAYTKDFWEYNTVSNAWTQKADTGTITRYLAAGFSIGSKGYIGTGYAGGSNYYRDFWEYDTTSNAWTQKADFGGIARYGAVGFSIGNYGYMGTGTDGSYRRNDFFRYDPSANIWCSIAEFAGTGRYYAVGFSIGSKGYVGTGFDGTSRNDFWEYDPYANSWTSKANFGGAGRYGAAGFSAGDRGYIGTGYNGTSNYRDFYEYSPASNTWTRKKNFGGSARRYAAGFGFSDGNRGYIGTGYDSAGRNDIWEYCSAASPTTTPAPTTLPLANSWCRKADFPGCARFGASGMTIDDKGYVGLGVCNATSPTFKKDWWEYDPTTDSWTSKTDFGGIARRNASEFVLGNSGYVTTGYGGSMPNDVWVYNPGTDGWATTTAFSGGGRENAVGFSINGVGYVGTGVASGSFGKWDFWALQYNPVTGWGWTQKANVTYPGCPWSCNRAGAVGFVIGDKGYIATGYRDQSPDGLELLEYDSGANTWTRKTDYGSSYARQSATAFVLNNIAYVGLGGLSGYFWDFWAYNPDTDSWTQKGNFPGGPRSATFEFVIDGKGYVGTGMGNSPYCPSNEYCKDFWQYNP